MRPTDRRDAIAAILAVAVVAIVVCGEAFTYAGKNGCGFTADADGSWEIETGSGSIVYTVSLMSAGVRPDRIAIYFDEGYGAEVNPALVEVGARALDTEYYISQLRNNLRYLGVGDAPVVDAEGLKALMEDGSFSRGGIVCISGALPDTVYDGTSSSPVLEWISGGGTLYWAEQQVGRFIGHADGTVTEAAAGFQTLFLGSECLTDMEQDSTLRAGIAYGTVDGDRFREALYLKNNNILYAVQTDRLVSESLAIGFTEQGCASIVFVRSGAGQVCVFGGDYSNHQRMDMATVIAAGVGVGSEIAGIAEGSVRDRASGSFDVSGREGMSVFGLLGGDFAIFGKRIDLGASP